MPQYSAFIALDSGHYAEVDHLIEAPDPVSAAQRLLDSETIDLGDHFLGDHFPIFLIVEERSLSVFTRDRQGRAVTPVEGIRRGMGVERDGPRLQVLSEDSPEAS